MKRKWKQNCDDRQEMGSDPARCTGGPGTYFRLGGFSGFAALACGGCQSRLPPLPNPPGPKTTVRLSPGDKIKVTFAEESDLDQTEQIRRDGKISLPLIGEITAADKRVIDLQHEIVGRYEG